MKQSPLLTFAAFALVLVTVIGGAALLLSSRPEPVHIIIQPPAPTPTLTPPANIEVYVTGAVAQPNQLIQLPHGSRVSDALAAVGGMTAAADAASVNLAAILRDGDQIHVFEQGAQAVSAGIATPQGGAVVYINSATLEELKTLPGVGDVLAARIIERREQIGRFTGMADLDTVSGIGEALIERLTGLISFE
jgi:competence protein ComEA